MLAYAQPIVESWNNIPSHGINGEIELLIRVEPEEIEEGKKGSGYIIPTPAKLGEPVPNLDTLRFGFDVKNVTDGLKFENDTSFYFNPQEGLLWKGVIKVTVDNQTFRKPFTLELLPNDPPIINTDEYGHKSYLLGGSLWIGNNGWNPVSGWVTTAPSGDTIAFNIWSHVDHLPDPSNNM
jgi:hypothetical protein